MRTMASALKVYSVSKWLTVFGFLFLACSLFGLYLADAYSPLNPQGLLASEIYHYGNATARPNFIIYHRQLLFKVAIACVAMIALFARFVACNTQSKPIFFNQAASYLSCLALCLITILYLIYSFPLSFLTQVVAFSMTGAYFVMHMNKNRIAYMYFYFMASLAFVCVLWQLTHFGKIPYIAHSYDLFAADNHLTVLLSPAYRLNEGYTWFNGIQPTYTFLLPILMQIIVAGKHVSLQAWFYLLQSLQVLFITLFILSALLQRRGPVTFLCVCATLTLFDPANVQLYFPNHFAWRFLDVSLILFCLSLGCYYHKKVSTLKKSLLAVLAIFLNFETGVVLTLALCGSEFFSLEKPLQRTTQFILSVICLSLFILSVGFHLSITQISDILQFGKTIGSAMGGWRYLAIPAFVTVFMHSVIIIWRYAYHGIRTPRADVRWVCAIFCVLWSLYFITRPDFVNFPCLLIVYAFLAEDLWSDVAWTMKKYRLLTVMTSGLLMFSYASYPLSLLSPAQLISIKKLDSSTSMKPITASSIELQSIVHMGDAYITPFSFFTQTLSGLSNHLSVADPFVLIPLQSQQTDFLNSTFPSHVFIARAERLFDAPTPSEYFALIAKIETQLIKKHYHRGHTYVYWLEYER